MKEAIESYFNQICEPTYKAAKSDLSNEEYKAHVKKLLKDLYELSNDLRIYDVNYRSESDVLNFGSYWGSELDCNFADLEELGLKDYPKVIANALDFLKYKFEHPEEKVNGVYHITLDYTDLIEYPVYFNMSTPYKISPFLDYVLLDEAQDFSMLQQLFLKKLYNPMRPTRFIAVGDRKQSIFGFAGADIYSIDNLKKNLDLQELPLNICYRCAKNIIKLTKTIVPEIEYNPKREDEGIINIVNFCDLVDIVKPNDVIMARYNTQLLYTYKHFVIDHKRPIKFRNESQVNSVINEITNTCKDYIKFYNRGYNVEKELIAFFNQNPEYVKNKSIDDMMCNTKKEDKTRYLIGLPLDEEVLNAKKRELIRNKKASLANNITKSNFSLDYLMLCMQDYKDNGYYNCEDQNKPCIEYYDIILAFIDIYKKDNASILLNDFLVFMRNFLRGNLDKAVPVLSSIHMMKGGEADNIFILDYPRFPYTNMTQTTEDQQQEKNLHYVAITRAKKCLNLVKAWKPLKHETYEDVKELNDDCIKFIKKLNILNSVSPDKFENKDIVIESKDDEYVIPEDLFENVQKFTLILEPTEPIREVKNEEEPEESNETVDENETERNWTVTKEHPVKGFYRHYKDGKVVYVDSYIRCKGRKPEESES